MRIGVFGGGGLGVALGAEVFDVTDVIGERTLGPEGPLHALIAQGVSTGELSEAAPGRQPIRALDVAWSAPLPRPGKIIGAPANYQDHADEMPDAQTVADWGVFLKASSSVIGPGDAVRLPYRDKRTDHEGELGVVIGRTAHDVPAEHALEHVFGYTCVLDITVRSSEDRSARKSFDTFTPIGPWVTPAEQLGDPADLILRCWVNHDLRQESTTANMIYSVPELIAYASSVMTLHPGDVIATGTPAGVGPLRHGDVITVAIERVGRLQVRVSAAGAIRYADRPGRGGSL